MGLLKFVVLVFIFLVVFLIIYDTIKRIALFWKKELSDDNSLNDKAKNIEIEKEKLKNDLKEKEKEIQKQEKEIEDLKKKGF